MVPKFFYMIASVFDIGVSICERLRLEVAHLGYRFEPAEFRYHLARQNTEYEDEQYDPDKSTQKATEVFLATCNGLSDETKWQDMIKH